MLQSRRRRPGPMRSHAILSLRPRGSRTLVAIQKSIQAKADTGARGLRSRSSGFNARGSTPSVVGRFLQKTATSQYDTTHGRMCDGVGGCARRRFADPASRNVDGADETGRKRAFSVPTHRTSRRTHPQRPNPSGQLTNPPAKRPFSVPTHRTSRRTHPRISLLASQLIEPADETGRSVPNHRHSRRNRTHPSPPASRPIEPADEPTRSVPNHPVGRRNRTETGPTASQSVGAADESGRKQVVLRVGISTAPTKRDARVSSASR